MHYKVKVSSYIAQYLILRISQSRPSLADLFNQTSSQLLWEAIQPYAIINARRLLIYISTTVYSQVLMYTKTAQGLNTSALDSNPGPLS